MILPRRDVFLWCALLLAGVGLATIAETQARSADALVPQSGPQADAVTKLLTRIEMPAGFKISLFALVPGARQIAVSPDGKFILVGTMGTNVYALTPPASTDGHPEVSVFAPKIAKKLPNGVCFAPDGVAYLVEQNRVLAFARPASDISAMQTLVEQGALIPRKFESTGHSARVCKVGPDNKLYIAIGQPYNVPPPALAGELAKDGLGAIIRFNRDGSGREIYAAGIRNSVGLDFSPNDHTLWFTDNQVDMMGDDIPPGELNRATAAGQNFGFPYYGGGHTRTHEYLGETPPVDLVFPQIEMVAHAADLGMTFYRGTQFPSKFQGGIFSAQHGSWNRTVPIGARVMFTTLKGDGTAKSTMPFAEGWKAADGHYDGRPVDVTGLPDGSLLVSDDFVGAIYRISYHGPK